MIKSSKPLFLILISIAVFSLLQSCTQTVKPKIAQWRGPERNGIYNEPGLLNEWPQNGPELLWVYEGIGKGFAAPSVLNDKIFINGEKDSTSYLFAFDLNGKKLWESPNGKEFMGEGFSATYPGSRSTPTAIDDLVYTTSGMGRIACFEVNSGKEVWAVDLVQQFGITVPFFGYSESPVVNDGKLYCSPASSEINMAALDRFTGKTVWTSEALKDTFSYCSPIEVELPERKLLVTHSRHHLFTIDCENGEVFSSYNLTGYEWDGEHCNSPIYDNGNIYFIGNDEKGKGAIKLELNENGGDLKEIWYNNKIMNNFNGYVKVGEQLFTTVKGNWLKALSIENGNVTDSLKVATGSLIFADNKFICYGMNGDVNLITYDQNKLKVTGSFKIEKGNGHHFSHPVIDKGILLIRHGNALCAFKIKQ